MLMKKGIIIIFLLSLVLLSFCDDLSDYIEECRGANFTKIIPSGSVNSIDTLINGFAKPNTIAQVFQKKLEWSELPDQYIAGIIFSSICFLIFVLVLVYSCCYHICNNKLFCFFGEELRLYLYPKKAYRIGVYIFGMSGLALFIGSCIGVYFVYHDYLDAWNLSSCSLVDSFEYSLNPHANLRSYPWQGFIMDSKQMEIANATLYSAFQNLTDFNQYDLTNIGHSPNVLKNLVETIYSVHKNDKFTDPLYESQVITTKTIDNLGPPSKTGSSTNFILQNITNLYNVMVADFFNLQAFLPIHLKKTNDSLVSLNKTLTNVQNITDFVIKYEKDILYSFYNYTESGLIFRKMEIFFLLGAISSITFVAISLIYLVEKSNRLMNCGWLFASFLALIFSISIIFIFPSTIALNDLCNYIDNAVDTNNFSLIEQILPDEIKSFVNVCIFGDADYFNYLNISIDLTPWTDIQYRINQTINISKGSVNSPISAKDFVRQLNVNVFAPDVENIRGDLAENNLQLFTDCTPFTSYIKKCSQITEEWRYNASDCHYKYVSQDIHHYPFGSTNCFVIQEHTFDEFDERYGTFGSAGSSCMNVPNNYKRNLDSAFNRIKAFQNEIEQSYILERRSLLNLTNNVISALDSYLLESDHIVSYLTAAYNYVNRTTTIYNSLKSAFNCSYLNYTYETFHGSLCHNSTKALKYTMILMIILSFLGLFTTIGSLKSIKSRK